ncbi:MAG TPA: endonuclease, partial [Candidatus Izemoplasmatales bacterium]|nr:endonuclease [Candidatus Izemoplasmatales bacterium]
TLVRDDSVYLPATTYNTNEWTSYGQDTFDYLGTHSDVSPDDSILLEQDISQLPDVVDLYDTYDFGFGSNGSSYTIINVTGDAASYVQFNDAFIETSTSVNADQIGVIEVEVNLDGVGTETVFIALTVKYSSLDTSTHPEYYASLDQGLSGETLLLALRSLINNAFSGVDYGTARTALAETDEDPNNPDNVILVYLQTSVDASWDNGATWNREHVWPQSYLGDGADNSTVNIASDLHNLKPSNPLENSSRGNKYFDYVTTSNTYEPTDEVKGDIARIMLYMIVMYDYLDLVNDPSVSETYKMGVLSTILEWHILDPVSDFELNRNNVIYTFQNNRNPFIDHPEYVELIWGTTSE